MKKPFLFSSLTVLSTLAFLAVPVVSFSADKSGSVPLDTRVERLERRIGRLTELMMQVDALKRENSELRGQLELQNHTIESLKRRQRDLYIDIDSRLTNLQSSSQTTNTKVKAPAAASAVATKSSPVSTVQQASAAAPPSVDYQPVTQATSTSADEDAEYQKAFKLLSPSEKRYPEAIKALNAFLQKYPQSKLADNAQYWLAEANYVSQKNDVALVEFQKVIKQFPNSPKVSGALLKIGYLQHAAGQTEEAKKALNEIITSYPGTSAASMAKKRLQRIQQGH